MSARSTGLHANRAGVPIGLVAAIGIYIVRFIVKWLGSTSFLLNYIIHKGMVYKKTT